MRMLMNNLDPEVAEHPNRSSSTAGAAKPPAHGKRSTRSSRRSSDLEPDQTLLVQSGKPVGVCARTRTRRAS